MNDAESEKLVELARPCIDFSLPDDVIRKNNLRLRRYCRRLMARCSDPRVYLFMVVSYDDVRKRVHWQEKYLRTRGADFRDFVTLLENLMELDERLPSTYARSLRMLDKQVASGVSLTEAEHGLFFTYLIEMAEKVERRSDAARWKRVRMALKKRGRFRPRPN